MTLEFDSVLYSEAATRRILDDVTMVMAEMTAAPDRETFGVTDTGPDRNRICYS